MPDSPEKRLAEAITDYIDHVVAEAVPKQNTWPQSVVVGAKFDSTEFTYSNFRVPGADPVDIAITVGGRLNTNGSFSYPVTLRFANSFHLFTFDPKTQRLYHA